LMTRRAPGMRAVMSTTTAYVPPPPSPLSA
jgi:hypothetical protein